MSSFFTVVLDTTAPPLSIEALPGSEPGMVRVLLATTEDATQVRLWGSIDPTDPVTNGKYGETEGEAEYFDLEGATELLVRVLPGAAELHVQVRDEVWNESAVVDVQAGEEEAPPPGREQPQSFRRKPSTPVKRRLVRSRDRLGLRSGSSIRRAEPGSVIGRSTLGVRSRGACAGERTLESGSRLGLRSRGAHRGALGGRGQTGLASSETIIRRGDPDEEALLALLL